jgi:hypothetical protein
MEKEKIGPENPEPCCSESNPCRCSAENNEVLHYDESNNDLGRVAIENTDNIVLGYD